MQQYNAPEGFLYDQNTGLYYKCDFVTDNRGQQVQWVTWFDTQSGEYSQYSYPQMNNHNSNKTAILEHISTGIASEPESDLESKLDPKSELKSEPKPEAQPEQQSQSPSAIIKDTIQQSETNSAAASFLPPPNFELDAASGLYFRTDYVNDPNNGKSTKWVTWFDTLSGKYTQESFEVIDEQSNKPFSFSTSSAEQTIPETTPKYVEQTYEIPENFTYDNSSALYFSSVKKTDENGYPIDFVTWFDAQTGEYSQVEYLRDRKADPTKEHLKRNSKLPLTIGCFVMLLIIGVALWHFKPFDKINLPSIKQQPESSEMQLSTEGLEKQQNKSDETKATTDDSQEQDVSGETESTYETTNIDCSLEVQIKDAKSAVIRLQVPNLQSSYPGYDPSKSDGEMLNNWEVIFDNYSVAVNLFNNDNYEGHEVSLRQMENSLWEVEGDGNFSLLTSLLAPTLDSNTIVWDIKMPVPDFDFNKVEKFEVRILTQDEEYVEEFPAENVLANDTISKINRATSSSFSSVNSFGTHFGHANLFYMLADEDEDYIYTLHQFSPEWKFSMEGIKGAIYRIPKRNAQAKPDKIIDINGDGYSIASFTVLEDYIYFSVDFHRVESGVNQYGYFRAPKNGGSAEYLFTDEESYMRNYGGKVYFLFRNGMSFGWYDPEIDYINYEGIDIAMSDEANSEFSLFMPFSVFDGNIYFGGMFDSKFNYYTYNLESKETFKIANGDMSFVLTSDEGAAAIYGINPIFEGEEIIFNPDSNGFLAITSEDTLILHDTVNNLYASIQINLENGEFNPQPLDIQLPNQSIAYGTVSNWLLFNEKAVKVENGTIKRTVSFLDSNTITNKWILDIVIEMQNQ